MPAALTPIVSLLIATLILLSGNGLQGTLVAVRGNIEAFPVEILGLLMSAYYVGFIVGCIVNPFLVKRVGHIRAYAALAAIASAAALVHALVVEPITWLLLRSVVGFCFAGLSMVAESWINERATNETRGRILSVYRIVDLSGVTLGQLLLTLADPAGFTLFCLISILITLALVPVSLTTSAAPRPLHSAKLNFTKLFKVSPLAAWGGLAAGLSNGSFWGLGPVFLQNTGLGMAAVATFMSSVIVGGAIAQFPIGLLSDRFDRRHVLVAVTLTGALFSLCVAASPNWGMPAILATGFLFGGAALSNYSMAVAHANDRAEAGDFVEISSTLLLSFGIGASIGPFVGALAMRGFGDNALFIYTAIVQAGLGVYGLIRMAINRGVPLSDQEDFVPAPRTTPEIIDLDPRSSTDLADTAAEETPKDDAQSNSSPKDEET